MSDETHHPWRLSRIVAVALSVISVAILALFVYVLYIVVKVGDRSPLPAPQIHTMLLGVPIFVTLLSSGLFCWSTVRRGQIRGVSQVMSRFSDVDRRLKRIEERQIQWEMHYTSTMSQLNQRISSERSEPTTDRLRVLIRTEIAEWDRDPNVIHLPSMETREAFRSLASKINLGPRGDTSGDIRRGRNGRE